VIPGKDAAIRSHVTLSSNLSGHASCCQPRRAGMLFVPIDRFIGRRIYRGSRPVGSIIFGSRVPSSHYRCVPRESGIAVHSRECIGRGADLRGSRPALVSAPVARVRPSLVSEGTTVYFPPVRERRYRQGTPESLGCRCLAAKPAPGCRPLGGHRVSPLFEASTFLPSTPHFSRGETFCRGKGRTCTKHVSRTCPSSPSGKCDAITTGALGKRPARDLHADARVSFFLSAITRVFGALSSWKGTACTGCVTERTRTSAAMEAYLGSLALPGGAWNGNHDLHRRFLATTMLVRSPASAYWALASFPYQKVGRLSPLPSW
jgi:hypothetical protein